MRVDVVLPALEEVRRVIVCAETLSQEMNALMHEMAGWGFL
jgi:hypothetical protein